MKTLGFDRTVIEMLIWSNAFRDANEGTGSLKYRMVVVVGYTECFERVNREMSYEAENFRIRLQKGERGRERRRMSFNICYIYDGIVNQHC